MNEINAGIYGALAPGGTMAGQLAHIGVTGVYYGRPPRDHAGPHVIFQKLSGAPTYTFGGLAYEDCSYVVKAIVSEAEAGAHEYAAIDLANSIKARVRALLDDAALDCSFNGNAKVLMICRRTSEIEYAEETAGQTTWHAGDQYHIGVS